MTLDLSQLATGRRPHERDPRNRDHAAPKKVLLPKSWSHKMGPVLDQGQVGACTGFSGADWLNSATAIGNRRRYNRAMSPQTSGKQPPSMAQYLGNQDGLALYHSATLVDDIPTTYPPTDSGSTGQAVGKVLKNLGVVDQYLWTFSMDQALAWGQRQVVMLGTIWTDAMMEPDANGVITTGGDKYLKKAESEGQGHEYTLRGVNRSTNMARIRNHWTAQWGLGGEALISLADLETLIITYKGDVCVPEVVTK